MRSSTARAGVVVCALSFVAAPGTALAADAGAAEAPLELSLSDASLTAGQRTTASGSLGRALAGERVGLELQAASGAWRELVAGPVAADGRYRLRGRVPRSGRVRVVAAGRTSASRRVRVSARLRVGSRRLQIAAGSRARVAGRVTPGVTGLPVALEVRRGEGWVAIASRRTRARGAFSLADRRRTTGSAPVRLRVSGARAGVASTTRSLGRLDVYRTAYASWYGPGLYGNRLGCGGTLSPGTLGVAHKTLPCGTQVSLRYGSRTVRVPVVDRGPYVGGREYDLTAATADRLGFRGHGALLATR